MSAPKLRRVRKYRPLPDGLTQERIDRFANFYSGRALSGVDPTITASLPSPARARIMFHFRTRYGMRPSHPALVALRKLWKETREELGDFYVSPKNPTRRPRRLLPGGSELDRTGTYAALLVLDPATPAPKPGPAPHVQRLLSEHANESVLPG